MGPPPLIPPKISILSSSPGRAEKLPTPALAPLLRPNAASRSRSRSRSSPLFPCRNLSLRRAAPSIDPANDAEPSSPKVTCIGQVRIRTKHATPIKSDSKQAQSEQKKKVEREMRCCYSLFWTRLSVRLQFKRNAGKESVELTESVPLPLNHREVEEYSRVFVPPPKNALVLMRCRSAPHNRSSALAAGFLAAAGEGGKGKEEDQVVRVAESKKFFEEEMRCESARPLVLKRCNSEPAVKAVRLVVPEAARCSQNGDELRKSPLPLQ